MALAKKRRSAASMMRLAAGLAAAISVGTLPATAQTAKTAPGSKAPGSTAAKGAVRPNPGVGKKGIVRPNCNLPKKGIVRPNCDLARKRVVAPNGTLPRKTIVRPNCSLPKKAPGMKK